MTQRITPDEPTPDEPMPGPTPTEPTPQTTPKEPTPLQMPKRQLSMAYEEELIADTDAKDDHRALRARSAECIPVGSKDLVESELISTLAFSPPPK